jgi:hypothetical protein
MSYHGMSAPSAKKSWDKKIGRFIHRALQAFQSLIELILGWFWKLVKLVVWAICKACGGAVSQLAAEESLLFLLHVLFWGSTIASVYGLASVIQLIHKLLYRLPSASPEILGIGIAIASIITFFELHPRLWKGDVNKAKELGDQSLSEAPYDDELTPSVVVNRRSELAAWRTFRSSDVAYWIDAAILVAGLIIEVVFFPGSINRAILQLMKYAFYWFAPEFFMLTLLDAKHKHDAKNPPLIED